MKRLAIKSFMLLLVLSFIMSPIQVFASTEAETINDLKEQLADLKQQKIDSDNAKSQTESQITTKKNAIYAAYKEQEEIAVKVTEAEAKIEESNLKIAESKEQIDDLLRFYQISNGNNAYLEYVSGASSTTDLIMRTAIVEQLSAYNKEIIDNMNALIEENEQLKLELEERNKELEQLKEEYNKALDSLGDKLSELNEVNEDISDQIKNQEALIDYYETVCDSDTQKLSECVNIGSATGFIRPVVKGRITSYWGYRTSPITGKVNSFHNAIDIGGNKEGTPVYAAALGMVAAITRKSRCGGNIIYIHHNVLGKAYTTQYAHLLTVKVKVGDVVSATTQIGTIGGGSSTTWDKCSTGAHLHFGISTGHYLGAGKDSYSSWSKFIASSVNPLNYLPSGTRWSTRY
ncbi:MAG TPA: peptidoglycan DD-metalloendopeptidase family protein [Bacilli bacterium]|nr:peptidoglycan DD-metalloendopeptidase family protein [Bacilli bacterium]